MKFIKNIILEKIFNLYFIGNHLYLENKNFSWSVLWIKDLFFSVLKIFYNTKNVVHKNYLFFNDKFDLNFFSKYLFI